MADDAELPDLDLRKEWTRLRALLYETHHLALCTDERDSHRWLTDQFVLLDVTDSIAIEGVEDGVYKLVQSKGFVVREGAENYLNGGIVDYLTSVEQGACWAPVLASQWSVAEHPGKAMLLVAGTPWPPEFTACLMGESTWTALHRHYAYMDAEPIVCYDTLSNRNLFRVQALTASGYVVVAYVAGIRIPDGQETIASSIAKMTLDGSSTSN